MTTPQLYAVTPVQPQSDPSEIWRSLRDRGPATPPPPPSQGSVMEGGVSVFIELSEAPPRTLHSAALVKSSPLSSSVRAMLESREFGRRFDAIPVSARNRRTFEPLLAELERRFWPEEA